MRQTSREALHLLLLLLDNSDSAWLSIDFCETHELRLFRTASTSCSTTSPYFPAMTSIATVFLNQRQIYFILQKNVNDFLHYRNPPDADNIKRKMCH